MATMMLNSYIALLVFLLAVGTLNTMNGRTGWPIRIAILLIMGAMLCQTLGAFTRQWDHWMDTLLYCGMAAFLLACRRDPIGIPRVWAGRFSLVISTFALAYVVITFPWSEAMKVTP